MTYVASHAGIFELIFADLLLSESLRILAFICKICLALAALVTVKMLPFSPPVQRIVRPHRRFCHILLLALHNPNNIITNYPFLNSEPITSKPEKAEKISCKTHASKLLIVKDCSEGLMQNTAILRYKEWLCNLNSTLVSI